MDFGVHKDEMLEAFTISTDSRFHTMMIAKIFDIVNRVLQITVPCERR